MSKPQWMPRIAALLKRFPWLMIFIRVPWRIIQPRVSMGVVGVVINDNGHILFVEHVFHPHLPWGLPGGWVERNEDPAVTLKRELVEELSLDAEVGPIIALETIKGGHVNLAYLCYPRGEIGKLCFELLSYQWVDPATLPPTHTFHVKAVENAQHLHKLMSRNSACQQD